MLEPESCGEYPGTRRHFRGKGAFASLHDDKRGDVKWIALRGMSFETEFTYRPRREAQYPAAASRNASNTFRDLIAQQIPC
jgi:hypothetical protein